MWAQVVLINWFTTCCPPCQPEMPHLQAKIWERFASDGGLALVSIAREEKADVAPFITKYRVTWPFALDPEGKAFALYAEGLIPRNTIIGRDGRIVFQSTGFNEPEFNEMVQVIAAQLAAP